jgi:hypothetical protein
MKKNIIVLMLAIAASLSGISQPLKVPAAVKTAFNAKFPNATNVKWGKENAKEFEAEFKLNNKAISANFGMDGSWVETESGIPVSDLPAAVSAAIKAKYPGAPFTGAEKTEQPGNKVIYEVTIKVNGKKKGIEINPDGSFVK